VWCSFSPAVPTVRALLVVDAVVAVVGVVVVRAVPAVPGTVARARTAALPVLVNPAGSRPTGARCTRPVAVVQRAIAR
jgi:hypothetical protein